VAWSAFPGGSVKNTLAFSDGSKISWLDRETLIYEESTYRATIWLDFAPGLFSRARVLKLSSLSVWRNSLTQGDEPMSDEKKAEIIEKVRIYYAGKKILTE